MFSVVPFLCGESEIRPGSAASGLKIHRARRFIDPPPTVNNLCAFGARKVAINGFMIIRLRIFMHLEPARVPDIYWNKMFDKIVDSPEPVFMDPRRKWSLSRSLSSNT